MRFSILIAAAAVAVSGVAGDSLFVNIDFTAVFGHDLSAANGFGSPLAPWLPDAQPGWYYGSNPSFFPELAFLKGIICEILALIPHALHCPKPPPHNPPPSDGYTQTFSNLTGATQASDFQTFGLVDTIPECKAMCDSVDGCTFVNTYHDVNGKGGSTQLTCSLFTLCHTASDATNTGGQSQPDGSIDFITNSDGWCKA